MDKLQTLQQELWELQSELAWNQEHPLGLSDGCLQRVQEAIDQTQAQIAALKEEEVFV